MFLVELLVYLMCPSSFHPQNTGDVRKPSPKRTGDLAKSSGCSKSLVEETYKKEQKKGCNDRHIVYSILILFFEKKSSE